MSLTACVPTGERPTFEPDPIPRQKVEKIVEHDGFDVRARDIFFVPKEKDSDFVSIRLGRLSVAPGCELVDVFTTIDVSDRHKPNDVGRYVTATFLSNEVVGDKGEVYFKDKGELITSLSPFIHNTNNPCPELQGLGIRVNYAENE